MCKCPPKIRWHNGILQIMSCGEWLAVPGTPPAAINPDPGTLPDIFTPPDPDDPEFDPQNYACGKADALTDFLFDKLESIKDVAEQFHVVDILNASGGILNIFGVGATLLNNILQAVIKVLDIETSIAPDEQVQLLKLIDSAFIVFMNDPAAVAQAKKELKCELAKKFSKEPALTLADMTLFFEATEAAVSLPGIGLITTLMRLFNKPANRVKLMQIAQTGSLTGACDDCFPPPPPPSGFEDVGEGCYKGIFKSFARYDASGNPYSGDIYAQPKGTRLGAGFAAAQNGTWVNGQPKWEMGVVLELSQLVELRDFYATVEAASLDNGGNVNGMGGALYVSADGQTWHKHADFGSWISGSVNINQNNIQNTHNPVKFVYIRVDANGARPWLTGIAFGVYNPSTNSIGIAALGAQFCF